MDDFRTIGAKNRNWGRWGEDDRLGTLNHIRDHHVVQASKLVRRGKIFNLALQLSAHGPAPGINGRINPLHFMSITPLDMHAINHVVVPADILVTDDWITMPLQCSTQWDGLGHVGYDGCFYNSVSHDTITTLGGSSVLSIEDIVEKGVSGRGVLLDIAALRGVDRLGAGEAITPLDLEAAERRQGVRAGAGDILLIRTGWIRNFTVDGSAQAFWAGEPGIDLSCAEWLNRREIAAVASDNFGVEVVKATGKVDLKVHCVLIRDMGMTLGEIFDLDGLAADCAADGVWDCFFTAAPLRVKGGVGSPITPIAIK